MVVVVVPPAGMMFDTLICRSFPMYYMSMDFAVSAFVFVSLVLVLCFGFRLFLWALPF